MGDIIEDGLRRRIAELEAKMASYEVTIYLLSNQQDTVQQENAKLREALTSITTALDAYGVRWCRDVAKDALQEKGE